MIGSPQSSFADQRICQESDRAYSDEYILLQKYYSVKNFSLTSQHFYWDFPALRRVETACARCLP